MKQDDFERLKAICEKEGFEIDRPWDEGMVVVKKTDPWEGVEFVEFIGFSDNCFTNSKIYKVKYLSGNNIGVCIDDEGDINGWGKKHFKPSTETSYVEQLKKEAIEKLGDFKIYQLDFSMMHGGSIQNKETFVYRKDTDTLYSMGKPIYQQGKWAERLKERVKVDLDYEHHGQNSSYYFISSGDLEEEKYRGSGQFLASQLEKYLNGEIE